MTNMMTIAAALASFSTPAPASPNHPSLDSAEAIVITANRTGIPVWRVNKGDGGTLVLVGTIRDVAKGTKWEGEALELAVSQADRVMFPQMMRIGGSPFAMVGWLAKWRARQKLPKGQSLSALLSPADQARAVRLAATGVLPRDWDRFHPLHLAFKLQDGLRERTGIAKSADSFVQGALRKHKVPMVPIASSKAKPIADELFNSTPQSHVPCLSATLALVEAGPDGLRRRSADWASRRVRQALASPAEAVDEQCWPAKSGGPRPPFFQVADGLLRGRESVLAVIALGSLARPGGLLDQLEQSGAEISGPAWK